MRIASVVLASLLGAAIAFAVFDRAPAERETLAQPSPTGDAGDYLSAELRRRVEQLKVDVRESPTDGRTVQDRTRVLWDWANAFARRGGLLPVELPSRCAFVLSRWPGTRVDRRHPDIDRLVRELEVREEEPEAIGRLTSADTGPFPAASYQTIEQTYTVGRMPMVPGGGVLVAKHFLADHGRLQTTDAGAVNHVTIRCSNPAAEFVVTSTPMRGMHGGLRGAAETLTFQLRGAELKTGDRITVTYGDRSGGSRGFKVQSYSNEHFPLPLYVDLEGKGNFFSLPTIGYRVVGKAVRGVHAFAPSVVGAGEPFELSVRSQDEHYNRATGPIPAYSVSVNQRSLAEIPAGEEAISVLRDVRLDEPGVYRFAIRSEDGRLTGTSNPVWVQESPATRIYWGETHGHSGFAEGQGTPDAYFRFGRDEARLDFLTHSEHDLWMDDREWETLVRNVEKYNEEGRFIALLGYEWTMKAEKGGHHNVFFRTPGGRKRVPVQEAPALSDLYQGLAAGNDMKDVLVIPHAHEPGEYRLVHPRMVHLVEIMSMHGRSEWFGIMYLKHGHRVGFIAASDDHLSHPGYPTPLAAGLADSGGLAAVLAGEKTTDAIFDALKGLAAYATTGDRMIVDFELNGGRMGSRVEYDERRDIRGHVFGTAPIDTITLVKNGTDIWKRECLATDSARFVEVRFWSPSDPVVRDSPRGWRPWEGTLTVRGAQLTGVSAPSLYNPRAELVRRDDENESQVHFRTITRGGEKGVILELEGAGPETTIDVSLAANRERFSTPSSIRAAARLPAESFSLSIGDIDSGGAVHTIEVERFRDTVSLRRIDPEGPLDQTFELRDTDSPERGDYYYVRITQLNGAAAWSSPIWVGGYGPQ